MKNLKLLMAVIIFSANLSALASDVYCPNDVVCQAGSCKIATETNSLYHITGHTAKIEDGTYYFFLAYGWGSPTCQYRLRPDGDSPLIYVNGPNTPDLHYPGNGWFNNGGGAYFCGANLIGGYDPMKCPFLPPK